VATAIALFVVPKSSPIALITPGLPSATRPPDENEGVGSIGYYKAAASMPVNLHMYDQPSA
jgi:hypothetical protein